MSRLGVVWKFHVYTLWWMFLLARKFLCYTSATSTTHYHHHHIGIYAINFADKFASCMTTAFSNNSKHLSTIETKIKVWWLLKRCVLRGAAMGWDPSMLCKAMCAEPSRAEGAGPRGQEVCSAREGLLALMNTMSIRIDTYTMYASTSTHFCGHILFSQWGAVIQNDTQQQPQTAIFLLVAVIITIHSAHHLSTCCCSNNDSLIHSLVSVSGRLKSPKYSRFRVWERHLFFVSKMSLTDNKEHSLSTEKVLTWKERTQSFSDFTIFMVMGAAPNWVFATALAQEIPFFEQTLPLGLCIATYMNAATNVGLIFVIVHYIWNHYQRVRKKKDTRNWNNDHMLLLAHLLHISLISFPDSAIDCSSVRVHPLRVRDLSNSIHVFSHRGECSSAVVDMLWTRRHRGFGICRYL